MRAGTGGQAGDELHELVDFLLARSAHVTAIRPLSEGVDRLNALNQPPITDDEIEAAARAEREERRRREGEPGG